MMRTRRFVTAVIILALILSLFPVMAIQAATSSSAVIQSVPSTVPATRSVSAAQEEIDVACMVPFASTEGAHILIDTVYSLHFVQTNNISDYEQRFHLRIFEGVECIDTALVFEHQFSTIVAAEDEASSLDVDWDTAGCAAGTYTAQVYTEYKLAGTWEIADVTEETFPLNLTDKAVPLESIQLQDRHSLREVSTESPRNILTGESFEMSVSYFPADTTDDRLINFSVANGEAAFVQNNSGICVLTGTTAGTVDVIAECSDSVKTTGTVSIYRTLGTINELSLDNELTTELISGQNEQLLVCIDTSNGMFYNSTVNFLSSDKNVLTVDENGLITAVSEGTAKVTAAVSGKRLVTPFTVTSAEGLSEIVLSDTGLVLCPDAEFALIATAIANDGSEVYDPSLFTWTSSDDTIATVSADGIITVNGRGNVLITAAINELSASCTVIVVEHEWGEPTVIVEAGEHNEGQSSHECNLCGYYETFTTPAGHSGFTTTVVEPTCTTNGYTLSSCNECGYSTKTNVIPAIGHNWGESVVTLPPGAHTYGKSEQLCSNCGKTKVTQIPPTNRSSVAIVFNDVKEKTWYESAVNYVYTSGFFSGVSTNNFAPQGTMTRAMLVSVLYRIAGKPVVTESSPFTDVPDGAWFTTAVIWASSNKIVSGVGNNCFNPNGNVSREQIATILYRYASYKDMDVSLQADLSGYPDYDSISTYARTALQWAVAEELITGQSRDGLSYLAPRNSATRAEVAVVFMRFIDT